MAEGKDFFVSYTAVNEAWAVWIAVELERAGYTTVSQALDFRPGQDFVHLMQEAAATATRTIAVVSPAYESSEFGEAEWRAAFAEDPSGQAGRLVPVRVQKCRPTGLLRSRIAVDLVDLDQDAAREALLTGVGPAPPRPTDAPFPGTPAPDRFPGTGPAIGNLERRRRDFTGRDEVLERLHAGLHRGGLAPVLGLEAVHGLGGVGKTELAREFAHRFASDYTLIWWIPAERPAVAASALAALGRALGLPEAADQTETATAVFAALRRRSGWLLVYDNAEHPDDLDDLLPPSGAGHVLVTSRFAAWSRHADPVRLEVFDRAESVRYLADGTRYTEPVPTVLDALAELLGDLPLALAEAAAYLDETRLDPAAYLELLRERPRELFGLGSAEDRDGDQRRVATVWSVSLERVRAQAPEAEALLGLLAFLAPDVPRDLLPAHTGALPGALAAVVADPVRYNKTLAVLGRYSMVTLSPGAVGVHRLVQAVVRVRLGADDERAVAEVAIAVLDAAFPVRNHEPTTWERGALLLPHLLEVTAHAERLDLLDHALPLLDRASRYLRERGQYGRARPVAERALGRTRNVVEPDPVALASRRNELGRVLSELGEHTAARAELEEALRISLAALGPDHPTVAIRRGNLGCVLKNLGDHETARTELEETLRISLAALGPDDPGVAVWRGNLGVTLSALGEHTAARTEHEEALRIALAALGTDHPDVAIRRGNLGATLRDLGELAAARTEHEQALRITLAAHGPDHFTVAIHRSNLGVTLSDFGDAAAARTEKEEALRISLAALGPDHPTVATRRGNLATTLRRLGEQDAARAELDEALRVSLAALGPEHPTTTWLQGLRDDADALRRRRNEDHGR